MSEQSRPFLTWLLLVSLAFALSESVTAVVERSLYQAPKRLSTAVPALPQTYFSDAQFANLLATSGSTQTAQEVTNTPAEVITASQDHSARPQLLGILSAETERSLAIFHLQGKTFVLGVGQSLGDLTVQAIQLREVVLLGPRGPSILGLDSAPQSDEAVQATEQEVEVEPSKDPTGKPSKDELIEAFKRPSGKVSVRPVLKEGVIEGMRLQIADQEHPLARLGMKSGDVVKSINSTQLIDMDSLGRAMKELRNSSNLRFELEREGTPESLHVELAD